MIDLCGMRVSSAKDDEEIDVYGEPVVGLSGELAREMDQKYQNWLDDDDAWEESVPTGNASRQIELE